MAAENKGGTAQCGGRDSVCRAFYAGRCDNRYTVGTFSYLLTPGLGHSQVW